MKRILCYLTLLLVGLVLCGAQVEASQSSGKGKAEIGFIQGDKAKPEPKPKVPPKKVLTLPQTGDKQSLSWSVVGVNCLVMVGLGIYYKKQQTNK